MAVMTGKAPSSGPKLAGVHGLRGSAAFLVVMFHLWYIGRLSLPPWALYAVKHLYLSVHLFFAISAFSLFHSHVWKPCGTNAYLVRRFFRIAPLFYAVMLWNIDRAGWPGLGTLLANLTFTFNLFPGLEGSLVWAGWTVGVEMLFYLLLPLAFLYIASIRGFVALLLASLVIEICWWRWGRSLFGDGYTYFSLLSNLVPFAAGLAAYKLFLSPSPRIAGARRALSWAAAAMLAFLFFDPMKVHDRAPGLYFAGWGVAFAIACLVQALRATPLLTGGVFQWLGDRSFSIYLLHPIVIQLSVPIYERLRGVADLGPASAYAMCLAATLAILLPLAELAYRFIERPGMRMGQWVVDSMARRARPGLIDGESPLPR